MVSEAFQLPLPVYPEYESISHATGLVGEGDILIGRVPSPQILQVEVGNHRVIP
jgi:hypothetical protein